MLLNYAILTTLLLLAVGAWLSALFKYRQLTAYLALRGIPAPSVREWQKCAELVWESLFHRKK